MRGVGKEESIENRSWEDIGNNCFVGFPESIHEDQVSDIHVNDAIEVLIWC